MAALGILGGTFDPVHNAHLAMAHGASRHLSLGKVLFLPTGSPHYRTPAVAAPEHRVAMLQLALAGEPRFELDARELAPGATGYTVDTLRALREEIGPQTPLYFLMGADQLGKLESWHRPDEVRKLARIAVFARPGFELADGGAERVPLSPMNVSASEIRARTARGDDLSGMVPPAVANYIARHNLYR